MSQNTVFWSGLTRIVLSTDFLYGLFLVTSSSYFSSSLSMLIFGVPSLIRQVLTSKEKSFVGSFNKLQKTP